MRSIKKCRMTVYVLISWFYRYLVIKREIQKPGQKNCACWTYNFSCFIVTQKKSADDEFRESKTTFIEIRYDVIRLRKSNWGLEITDWKNPISWYRVAIPTRSTYKYLIELVFSRRRICHFHLSKSRQPERIYLHNWKTPSDPRSEIIKINRRESRFPTRRCDATI